MDWHIEHHKSIPSTQDLLKALAASGAQEGRVVIAEEQTSGRGRHGREWISKPGNLYMSLLLQPGCTAERIAELSLLCSVAIAQVVQPLLRVPDSLALKWPNDIMIDGDKICGILLESDIGDKGYVRWVAAGIGLNVTLSPAAKTTHVSRHSEAALDFKALRDDMLSSIAGTYDAWQMRGFVDIREQWLAMSYPPGTVVTVKLPREQVEGAYEGLDESGALLIRQDGGGVRRIHGGDVFMSG